LTAVGIVAALAAEARTLGPRTQRGGRLATLEDGSLICVSGMGAAAAERAGRALIEAGALGLISWGVAGGLDPALPAGTLLLPTAVTAHAATAVPTHAAWREQLAAAALAARLPVSRGLLLSSATVFVSVEQKAAAFAATGAVAVDMESFAVAQLAAAHRLPFISVRAIVDAAADPLPEALGVASEAGKLPMLRLLLSLALRPAGLGALARLAVRFRAARRTLREAAGTGALAVPSAS